MAMCCRSFLRVFAAFCVLGAPVQVFAHGREGLTNGVVVHPRDANQIIVRATFGLLYSSDGGTTFRYRCAEAVGFDPATEDPALAWLANDSLLVGTFTGISVGTSEGMCEFRNVDAFARRYAIDVQSSTVEPQRVFALDAPGAEANALMRSDDSGATWRRLFMADPSLLFERLRVAPSDENIMYITGAIPAGRSGPERRVQFLRSIDGGQTFAATSLVLETDERNAHVLAVDPTDPNIVYVRMVRRPEDAMAERLLMSRDGGATWTELLRARQISSLLLRGAEIWAGSVQDGLYHGTTTTSLSRIAPEIAVVRCLASRVIEGVHELWLCSNDATTFAVGASRDGGQTFVPKWRYAQANSTMGCACTSLVGSRCEAVLTDYFIDIGRPDEVFETECDAGIRRDAGAQPRPPSSGCTAQPLRRVSMLALGWLLLSAFVFRTRKRY